MTCDEAQELITALADNEFGDPERHLLEIHLRQCAGCRLAVDEERSLKKATRSAADSLAAPARLRDRILADRRIFPEKLQSTKGWREHILSQSNILRPALVLALLLVLGLPAFYFFNQTTQPIAFAAVGTYDLFVRGELPVTRANTANELKERLIRAVDGRFQPMGYDLEAMKLKPVAGMAREMQGRKILVAIYQGEGGSLLCYTFLGSERDAPPNAARFFDPDKKMHFYAFSRGRVNAVLHHEGDVICILVSEMPMEELLALARAKARPS
ncbi:MAG: anti-sigma factor family protein [Candidatus Binatia bacterium]